MQLSIPEGSLEYLCASRTLLMIARTPHTKIAKQGFGIQLQAG
jgi:hypothetical protein